MTSYDKIGNIVILKPDKKNKILAKKLLKQPSIETIVEKIGDIKGRLRTIKVKHLAGKKKLTTIHNENNCKFELDIEKCYFSPRQSNDRKLLASSIKKKQRILVMFAGIGAYPIVIYKNAGPKELTAVEISKACCKYFKKNIKLNNTTINLIQGDVKKKVTKNLGKFDVIVMTRPNLKTTFLEQALIVSKKNTKIYYHAFGRANELAGIKQQLVEEASKLRKKVKILKVIKAGEIAPYKFRYRIEIKVL